MFWDFISKRLGKKQSKTDLPEPTSLVGPPPAAPANPAVAPPAEPNLSETESTTTEPSVPNPIDTKETETLKPPAIPTWARSWLESTDIKEIKTESVQPGEAGIPENPAGNQSAEPAAQAGELPTEALAEPMNVEVKEMVLRQIHNSRSTARYMCSTEDLVEEQIRKAMERGEFDNLEGKGKPIKFEENPYEDPELRLSFKILKDAGFAPYWIEMGKQIDAEIAGCHMIFDRFLETLQYRKSRLGYLQKTPELEERVQQVLEACADKLKEANNKIDNYNLIVPIVWIQRKKLDVPAEVAKLRKKLKEIM